MAKKKKKNKKISLSENLYNELTTVRFSLNDMEYELDLGSEIIVDSEIDPHLQVEKISAVMGYLGSIAAQLHKEYLNQKKRFQAIEAKIDGEVRETGTIGEQRVLQAIRRDPRWIKAGVKVNRAREQWSRAYSLYYALKEKSAILISRSADVRATPSDAIYGFNKKQIIDLDDEED